MTPLDLFDEHKRELAASAITDDIAVARGYRSVSRPTNTHNEPREELARLGIPSWAIKEDRYFPGLLIPLYRATGERISSIFKPRVPVPNRDGKLMKYAAQKGRASVIDVHPRWSIGGAEIIPPIRDITVPLWITEGVKKADALTSQGVCTIALSGVYNWRSNMGTLGDWEDIPLRGRYVTICFDADAHDNPNVMRAMIRFGRWLKSKGVTSVGYLITPGEINGTQVKGADDYLAAGGTLTGLKAATTAKQPQLIDNTNDTFTDARLAETIADEVFDGGYCWAAGLGWLQWDGTRWRDCSDVTVGEAVRKYSLNRFIAAVTDADRDQTQIDGWRAMLSASRERAVIGMAKGIVEKRADEFDQHPDLLNTPNGVVDLETDDVLPHNPDLLMTKIAGVGYDPDATHPDWDAALNAIPDDVREYLQVRLGQAITGHTPPDDVLLIMQGGGENGKSTIAATIRKAIKDFFVLVSDRALMANPDAHPTELMDFRGARYAALEETPEARRLDTNRLKRTVGTPTITARHIRKDDVTFEATHTLVINTNHRPIVDDSDHAVWRRLQLITFPYRFRKRHEPLVGPNDRYGDPGLRDRCITDPEVWGACLAWLIGGARKWYSGGKVMPQPPERVEKDTMAWRAESDLLMAYASDRLVLDPASHVLSKELFADFNAWLKDKHNSTWTDRTFNARLSGHDVIGGHRITKRTTRLKPGLSRRPYHGDPFAWDAPKPITSENYVAWFGVRFAGPDDLKADDLDDDLNSAVSRQNEDHVTTVTASPVNPAVSHVQGLSDAAVTAVTRSWTHRQTQDHVTAVTDLVDDQPELPFVGRAGYDICDACHLPRTTRGHITRCGGNPQ